MQTTNQPQEFPLSYQLAGSAQRQPIEHSHAAQIASKVCFQCQVLPATIHGISTDRATGEPSPSKGTGDPELRAPSSVRRRLNDQIDLRPEA